MIICRIPRLKLSSSPSILPLTSTSFLHAKVQRRAVSLAKDSYYLPRTCFGTRALHTWLYGSRSSSSSCSSSLGSLGRCYSTDSEIGSRTRRSTQVSMSKAGIVTSLPERFVKARDAGDLLFFPSTVHTHEEHGCQFEIRLCPALQEKPELPAPSLELLAEKERNADKGTKTDPFAPPYIPNLFLGEVKDQEENAEYVVLFNKYSVVPHHILLVTKEFQSQSSPLFPPDLVQTYQLLLAARAAGRKFFAFYNCGSYSGASQPHKHLQLIPIEDDGPPVERLARAANLEVPDRPFSISALPYANHIRRLPTNLSLSTSPSELSEILSQSFLNLLDLSITTIRHDSSYPPGPPSYNVILTLEHLHIIPRKEETYTLEETKEKLNVNALGFAGMLLVKCEEELQAVRKEGIGKILRGVGLESVHEIQVSQDDDRLANL